MARFDRTALADDGHWLINRYACDCGAEWTDEWSCACDDDCPGCGTTCEAQDSEDITADIIADDKGLSRLTLAQVQALRPGQEVCVLIQAGGGDAEDKQLTIAPGEWWKVADVRTYDGPQGLAITVEHPCGVANSFDAADPPATRYPFALWEH